MDETYDLIVLGSGPGGVPPIQAFKRLVEASLGMLA